MIDAMRAMLLLASVAIGCGPRGPAPILTPTLPEPTAAGSDDDGGAEPPLPPLTPAKAGGLSSAVIAAVSGMPMYVAKLDGLVLFADEQAQAQDIIAAWAATEGLTVVPPKQTSEIMARAALGQHAISGKACGVGLDPFQAVARWRTELAARGKLEAMVYCAPDCVLQVSVSIGVEGEGGSEYFAAPFDPSKPWQAELAARLPTITDNGGHDRYGHLNNPVKPAGIARAPGANDLIGERNSHNGATTEAETRAGLQCLGGLQSSVARVEYDARGAITRCEPELGQIATPVACLCHVFAKHTGPAGARERLGVVLPSRELHAMSKDKLAIDAYAIPAMAPDPDSPGRFRPLTTDPALDRWEPPDRELLAACFVGATGAAAGELVARASVDFDADGTATKVVVTPSAGTLSSGERSCLHDAFMRVRAPCPSVAMPSATAEVHVKFEASR